MNELKERMPKRPRLLFDMLLQLEKKTTLDVDDVTTTIGMEAIARGRWMAIAHKDEATERILRRG